MTYMTGELECPLCAALASLAKAVSPDELEARMGWLKQERDAWRKRAEQAELNPGTPYQMEDDG